MPEDPIDLDYDLLEFLRDRRCNDRCVSLTQKLYNWAFNREPCLIVVSILDGRTTQRNES